MRKDDIKDAIDKRRIIPFSDGPKIVTNDRTTTKEDIHDAADVSGL